MSGTSSKTQVVSVRLPNKVVKILRRRAVNHLDGTLSGYIRDRILYDTLRKHQRWSE